MAQLSLLSSMKSTVSFILCLVITIGVAGMSGMSTAAAQSSEAERWCPIAGVLTATFQQWESVQRVTDRVTGRITITNRASEHTLGGVSVAVAVYENIEGGTPEFWTVLPDRYQLLPGEEQEIELDLSAAALPAGEYALKVFAIQGDKVAALGAVLKESSEAAAHTFIKETPQTSDVTMEVSVNGETSRGQVLSMVPRQPLRLDTKVENNNTVPAVDRTLFTIIAQGATPLGAAVRAEDEHSVALMPGSSHKAQLTDRFVEGGRYTAHAALVADGALQPVESVPLSVGTIPAATSWPYLAAIGLSDHPLQSDTRVVACVRYVGTDAEARNFLEPLGVTATLRDAAGAVQAEVTQESGDSSAYDYFTLTPGVVGGGVTLELDFLQQRFDPHANVEAAVEAGVSPHNFSVVDTFAYTFICQDSERCATPGTDAAVSQVDSGQNFLHSFWYYAAVVIAALLLMYLMLRRLPTRFEDTAHVPRAVSRDELQ